ncbi:aspartyl-phosphate phosphatase Spo0E family protein [Desulfosporosinus sp. PR]|uniref:aspartyl-phosphate phosphatase Spo0E family protein n=1 Tax=Candidatus Desulfosporosinus nitrosoreducens TaxID=3401928 RepID=UPI0027FEED43|nr:aspartyl-phosphate phosphatase Spo0E family protein [Desulfosporosinus sp. PR]MDQ7097039.1 aspartyl-phosphate phosphatase Spo0E family protein [Desulfosporosinus sp. PR]
MSPDEVLALIESLRSQLISLAQCKPLVDPEVVNLSQMLDSYLTLYHNIVNNLFA